MVGPAAKRAAVAHLEAKMGLSERRACSVAGHRPPRDEAIQYARKRTKRGPEAVQEPVEIGPRQALGVPARGRAAKVFGFMKRRIRAATTGLCSHVCAVYSASH
jgi:hypothetical protein